MKAFADDKINVTQKLKFVLWKVENIVGKEENAGYSIFFFSHNVFKRPLPAEKKSGLCGKDVYSTIWLSLESRLSIFLRKVDE